MPRGRDLLETVGRTLQRPIARSRWVAGCYLRVVGWLVKPLPDGPLKDRIRNALQWVEWNGVVLPPRSIELCSGMTVNLVPHPGEFDFEALLYRRLRYEPGVFSWLAGREYDTVIEIGANVGIYTLFFARRYPSARVYAFEASAAAYRRLQENLAANPTDRVITHNCAVADCTGFLDFFEPAGHLTNGSLDVEFARQFSDTVAVHRVPAVDAQGLSSLMSGRTLVKLDIEGAEPRVLAAMAAALRERRPDLVIEVLESAEAALNDLPFLVDGSYSLFNLADGGPVPADRFRAGRFRDFALTPS